MLFFLSGVFLFKDWLFNMFGGLSKETKAVNEAFHHVKVHFEYDGYKNSLVFKQHFDLFFLYNRKLF